MDFPIFRKYVGIDVWFKIDSLTKFTEIKMIGRKKIISDITATIYPEKQFINDMINCFENRWESIDEFDYLQATYQSDSPSN